VGDAVRQIGEASAISGSRVAVELTDDPSLDWSFLNAPGGFRMSLGGDTEGLTYMDDCSRQFCPPECSDCPCAQHPPGFEMKILVHVTFRASPTDDS
jgi:hypothetical protein